MTTQGNIYLSKRFAYNV